MRFAGLQFCSVLFLLADATAHPISHTDAWIKVSDAIDVRLNVFLDDIVRHQLGTPEQQSVIAADRFQEAVRRHTDTLLSQLQIFDQNGRPLASSVNSLPDWKPGADPVDVTADGSLKLTWKLRFATDTGIPTTLCFLHQFTHPDLTTPGELRLHLQHIASGKRIDAVIPPGRPHTVLLPDSDSNSPGSQPPVDANIATSRIVLAPTGIIHEFTAPLLLLDAAWPPAIEFRQQSSHPARGTSPALLSKSDVEAAKSQIAAWMQSNTELKVNDTVLSVDRTTVDFFPGGEVPDVAESTTNTGSMLPLFGTQVGVQMQFPRTSSMTSLELAFHAVPGPFTELTTEVITSTSRSSRLVPFAAQPSAEIFEPALRFLYQATDLTTVANANSERPLAFVSSAWNPIRVSLRRPGIIGTAVGLAVLLLTLGFAILRRSQLSASVRRCVWVCGIACGGTCVVLIPDSQLIADQQQATELTQGLLRGVYVSTMRPTENEAVTDLTRLLDEDLVEQIYVHMLESLASQKDEGLFIDILEVVVDSAEFREPPESLNTVRVNCRWHVRGTIQHWGHNHLRDLSLVGDIILFRKGDHWKIRSISQTESTDVKKGDSANRES